MLLCRTPHLRTESTWAHKPWRIGLGLQRRARARAGGWFSLCLAAANAALMLLWFWGGSRKRGFFDRLAVPLDSFLMLGDAADAQMSLTVAQQRVAVHGSGLHIKRARGAPPLRNPCLPRV